MALIPILPKRLTGTNCTIYKNGAMFLSHSLVAKGAMRANIVWNDETNQFHIKLGKSGDYKVCPLKQGYRISFKNALHAIGKWPLLKALRNPEYKAKGDTITINAFIKETENVSTRKKR